MIPLTTERGNLFASQGCGFRQFETNKKRGWTIQDRPTSNPSKALPDSPGRAARKPAGKKLQFSGTELLQLPDDSWREWLRETRFQGLLLFCGPAKQDSSKLGVSENCSLQPNSLTN